MYDVERLQYSPISKAHVLEAQDYDAHSSQNFENFQNNIIHFSITAQDLHPHSAA